MLVQMRGARTLPRWTVLSLVSSLLCVACAVREPDGAPLGVQRSTAQAAGFRLCERLAERASFALTSDADVSWASLLCELVDLDRFTRPPDFPFVAKMASSYNRAAVAPDQPGWFANSDFAYYLRTDGDEHVLMESLVPGAITRLWSANPSGLLRIYIDDRTQPALEVPMRDLFDGQLGSPLAEPFVFDAGNGKNAYLPLPYASYARVTVVTDEPLFYHVGYREYAPDTVVEPFSRGGLDALAPLVEQVATLLEEPSVQDDLTDDLARATLRLSAGAPTQAITLGPRVVRKLTVRGFDPSARALRGTRLVLTVDGERTVDAPLGDLFGSGPGLAEHESLTTAMAPDALTLRWPMPVGRELRAHVEANGVPLPALTVELRYDAGLPAAPRLFRAAWTGPRAHDAFRNQDWTLLHARGEGWYVGTQLNVANPSPAWWGEGDEKIYVDGEPFPSHFGTGTEDYFGYAWCAVAPFARPYVGQTRADGGFNYGRYALYRWHVLDAIPFTSELRFDLEVEHWFAELLPTTLHQDALTLFYAAPGATREQPAVKLEDHRIPGFLLPVFLPTPSYTCR